MLTIKYISKSMTSLLLLLMSTIEI